MGMDGKDVQNVCRKKEDRKRLSENRDEWISHERFSENIEKSVQLRMGNGLFSLTNG